MPMNTLAVRIWMCNSSCTHFCFLLHQTFSSGVPGLLYQPTSPFIEWAKAKPAALCSLFLSPAPNAGYLVNYMHFSLELRICLRSISLPLKATMLKSWQRPLLKGSPAASHAVHFTVVRAKLFKRSGFFSDIWHTYNISLPYLCLFSTFQLFYKACFSLHFFCVLAFSIIFILLLCCIVYQCAQNVFYFPLNIILKKFLKKKCCGNAFWQFGCQLIQVPNVNWLTFNWVSKLVWDVTFWKTVVAVVVAEFLLGLNLLSAAIPRFYKNILVKTTVHWCLNDTRFPRYCGCKTSPHDSWYEVFVMILCVWFLCMMTKHLQLGLFSLNHTAPECMLFVQIFWEKGLFPSHPFTTTILVQSSSDCAVMNINI